MYWLLDTNIISDMMKNPQGLTTRAMQNVKARHPDAIICTSLIVDCELRYGVLKRQAHKLAQARSNAMTMVALMPMGEDVLIHYAKLRVEMEQKGQSLGANDLLIAAHAISLNATLVSADEAFVQVPDLKLENWLVP